MSWTEASSRALEIALRCCRSCYQRNLVLGYEALSGNTLRGKAKRFGGRYARSRDQLLIRIKQAGVVVGERRGPHGKRILLLTSDPVLDTAHAAVEILNGYPA